MTCWLVGSQGLLGREVGQALQRQGIECQCTDREVDIGSNDLLEGFIRNTGKDIAWIINCSGYTAVDRAEEEPELAYRINADGTKNLALLAKALGAALIHISTDYVFNGQKNEPYTEDDPPDPLSVYGKSKLEGERWIRDSWDRHFILRTAWLFGAHGTNFVRTMLRLFQENDSIRVVNDQWGSPTYAHDLAEVAARIVRNDRREFGTYHYTNEGKTTWHLFATEIFQIEREEGRCSRQVRIEPIPTHAYPTKAQRPRNSCLSKEKVKRVLGERIRNWQEALKEFLEQRASL